MEINWLKLKKELQRCNIANDYYEDYLHIPWVKLRIILEKYEN